MTKEVKEIEQVVIREIDNDWNIRIRVIKKNA